MYVLGPILSVWENATIFLAAVYMEYGKKLTIVWTISIIGTSHGLSFALLFLQKSFVQIHRDGRWKRISFNLFFFFLTKFLKNRKTPLEIVLERVYYFYASSQSSYQSLYYTQSSTNLGFFLKFLNFFYCINYRDFHRFFFCTIPVCRHMTSYVCPRYLQCFSTQVYAFRCSARRRWRRA